MYEYQDGIRAVKMIAKGMGLLLACLGYGAVALAWSVLLMMIHNPGKTLLYGAAAALMVAFVPTLVAFCNLLL